MPPAGSLRGLPEMRLSTTWRCAPSSTRTRPTCAFAWQSRPAAGRHSCRRCYLQSCRCSGRSRRVQVWDHGHRKRHRTRRLRSSEAAACASAAFDGRRASPRASRQPADTADYSDTPGTHEQRHSLRRCPVAVGSGAAARVAAPPPSASPAAAAAAVARLRCMSWRHCIGRWARRPGRALAGRVAQRPHPRAVVIRRDGVLVADRAERRSRVAVRKRWLGEPSAEAGTRRVGASRASSRRVARDRRGPGRASSCRR